MLKFVLSCLFSFSLLLLTTLVNAKPDPQFLNFPSEAKVTITRELTGESFIDVEFMWSDDCKPGFTADQAVEFEIVIEPKCFLMPKYGRDDRSNCKEVMEGFENFHLPNDIVDFLNPEDINKTNCYVDVWNYWVPAPQDTPWIVGERCGGLDIVGSGCYAGGATRGADALGGFAVGLHDASKLVAGERYSFRYPVEINNSPFCVNASYNNWGLGDIDFNPIMPVDMQPFPSFYVPQCAVGPYKVLHNEWGRVYVGMEVFKNKCDLNCDWSSEEYTCPEVIGIVTDLPGTNQKVGCIDANKSLGYWINRLCAPTGEFKFKPGLPSSPINPTQCIQESDGSSEDLRNGDTCCLDLDGDGVYAKQGQWSMFGTQAGDCNDNDPSAIKNCPSWWGDFKIPIAHADQPDAGTDPPDAASPDAGETPSCNNAVYLLNPSPQCSDGSNSFCLHMAGDDVSPNIKQWHVCPSSQNLSGSYDYRLFDQNHPGVTVTDLQISSDGGCTSPTNLNLDFIAEGPANSANLQAEIHFPAGCLSSDCTFYTGVINVNKVCQ